MIRSADMRGGFNALIHEITSRAKPHPIDLLASLIITTTIGSVNADVLSIYSESRSRQKRHWLGGNRQALLRIVFWNASSSRRIRSGLRITMAGCPTSKWIVLMETRCNIYTMRLP